MFQLKKKRGTGLTSSPGQPSHSSEKASTLRWCSSDAENEQVVFMACGEMHCFMIICNARTALWHKTAKIQIVKLAGCTTMKIREVKKQKRHGRNRQYFYDALHYCFRLLFIMQTEHFLLTVHVWRV